MKDMSGFYITDELVDRVMQLMKAINPEKASRVTLVLRSTRGRAAQE